MFYNDCVNNYFLGMIMHLWEEAGVSRTSWYRYVKEFHVEVEYYGFQWLIEKLQERVKVKKSLAQATHKLAKAKSKLKMRRK
jgi:hypothetical protein